MWGLGSEPKPGSPVARTVFWVLGDRFATPHPVPYAPNPGLSLRVELIWRADMGILAGRTAAIIAAGDE